MQRYENFELTRELGRGATARIFLAKEKDSSKEVSLKIFHPKIFHDSQFALRVQREMAISVTLDHPNIVPVRRVIETSDPPALVMDYVNGQNLEKFQNRLPYILPEVSVLIVIEILKALEYAHARSVIHRDLKPENVLIQNDGRVFVTDFGLAKIQNTMLTAQSNVLLGSLDYMSPEQAKGDSITPVSDLFSAALILYYLTTGTRPFSRSTPLATLSAIKEEESELPQKRNPKLSSGLSRIIQKGLEKRPEDRYQSAAEFRQALENYLEGIGLNAEVLSLDSWVKDSTAFTLEALRVSAQRLVDNCESALKEKQWSVFLENLTHLSLKAPESPALSRLTENFKKAKQQKKRLWLMLLLGCLLPFGILGGYLVYKGVSHENSAPLTNEQVVQENRGPSVIEGEKKASENSNVSGEMGNGSLSPVKNEIAPIKKPKVAKPKPIVTPKKTRPKPVSKPPVKTHSKKVGAIEKPTRKGPPAVTTPSVSDKDPIVNEIKPSSEVPKNTGTVKFSVASGVRIIWDGKEVDGSKPLENQSFGRHSLVLERPGYRPIRTTVIVKSEEPTTINVK